MNETPDVDEGTRADGEFDPREAAQLLEQTRRQAEREFSMRPPLLMAVSATVILAAYGALWISTMGQHPYSGPNLGIVGLVYAAVAVSIAISVRVYQRATAGVSGPASRQRLVEGVAILVSFIGSPVLQGALKHYGASHAIVYGIMPAAGPLIIVGTTVVAIGAGKADWPMSGAAMVVVIGGIAAAFSGASASWLVAGIGLFCGVVGHAIATAWQQRSSDHSPVAQSINPSA